MRCADGSLYTGIARDVARRVGEHNASNVLAARYTRARRPVTLVYREAAATRSAAGRREYQIKQMRRQEKEALIAGAARECRPGCEQDAVQVMIIAARHGVEPGIEAAANPEFSRERIEMYKHIMLPLDGSKLSIKAVNAGIALARSIGARVTVMHVISHFHVAIEEGFVSKELRAIEKDHEEIARKGAQKLLDKVRDSAEAGGVKCETLVVAGDNPYQEIIKSAGKRKCDLIVMASHGRRGLEGLLLGSETAKVLTHSKIPVLVVR